MLDNKIIAEKYPKTCVELGKWYNDRHGKMLFGDDLGICLENIVQVGDGIRASVKVPFDQRLLYAFFATNSSNSRVAVESAVIRKVPFDQSHEDNVLTQALEAMESKLI
jgi:hypothetical protein